MATWTLQAAVNAVRRRVNDWIDTSAVTTDPPSHLSRLEPAIPRSGKIDGLNVFFSVSHYPVVSKVVAGVETVVTVQDDKGNLFAIDVAATDYTRGILALQLAPDPGTSAVIMATYFSMFYQDARYIDWINRGLNWMGFPEVAALGDLVSGLPDGLKRALVEFAASQAFLANSQQSADFFNFSVGGKTEDMADVAKNWREEAAAANKLALQMRNDYYNPRQGRALAPAMAISVPSDQQPWTPTR